MQAEDDDNRIKGTHDKYTDAYVNILNAYKDQISSSVEKRNSLKDQFFKAIKFIMILLTWIFAGTLGISLIVFGIMIWKNYKSVGVITGAITTIISSFSTMILSIFKLPKIIADYLFNKEEDKLMSEIIQKIQQYEIDAVQHDFEKIKYEKAKELNSAASNTNSSDADLINNSYNPVPDQDTDDSSVIVDDISEEIISS